MKLTIGQKAVVKIKVPPADTKVTWGSSNNNVLKVTELGSNTATLEALGEGAARVVATLQLANGSRISDSIAVDVRSAAEANLGWEILDPITLAATRTIGVDVGGTSTGAAVDVSSEMKEIAENAGLTAEKSGIGTVAAPTSFAERAVLDVENEVAKEFNSALVSGLTAAAASEPAEPAPAAEEKHDTETKTEVAETSDAKEPSSPPETGGQESTVSE